MRGGWRVGSIGATPLYVHLGAWAFLFSVAWLLATFFFPLRFPLLPAAQSWSLALAASLLFLLTIVAHELGHTWMAARRGLVPGGIALFYFGASAWFEEEPRRASDEALVALAGPAASVVVSLTLLGVAWLLALAPADGARLVSALLALLGQLSLLMVAFNLLPAYPLDGGRALHALFWRLTGDEGRGIRAAGLLSQALGVLAAVAGLAAWFSARWLFGTLLAFALGWLLYRSGQRAQRHLALRRWLGTLRVETMMRRDGPTLHPAQPLSEAAALFHTEPTGVLPVLAGTRFVGLLPRSVLKGISREERRQRTVEQAMQLAATIPALARSDGADTALRRMERANLPLLPVLEGDQFVGRLCQHDLIHAAHQRGLLEQ